jgi:hypothetical protein
MLCVMNARAAWWEPSWKRLLAITAVLFVAILLLLAERVHAGADPALARSAAPRAVPSAPPVQRYGFDPYAQQDPYAQPDTQIAPPMTHAS